MIEECESEERICRGEEIRGKRKKKKDVRVRLCKSAQICNLRSSYVERRWGGGERGHVPSTDGNGEDGPLRDEKELDLRALSELEGKDWTFLDASGDKTVTEAARGGKIGLKKGIYYQLS